MFAGIDRSTAARYIRKYAELGHVEIAQSAGRKRKLSDQSIDELTEHALQNNFKTNRELQDHLIENNQTRVSENTISRYLRSKGVRSRIAAEKPMLTQEAKERRVEAALSNLLVSRGILRRTAFIDEFSIDTRMKRKTRVKRLSGGRYADRNIRHYELRNPKSVSFVCCFSYLGVGPIRMTSGRFNSERYLEFLQEAVIPFYHEQFDGDFYLLHDNARIHTARAVQEYLSSAQIRVLDHPPYSPDFNPIENLGNTLKKRVYDTLRAVSYRDHGFLSEIVENCWLELNNNIEHLKSLVDSLHTRYNQCITVNGDPTKY